MRVYISGPITGNPEYERDFAETARKLTAQGYEVINPANLNSVMPSDATHDEYMSICLNCLIWQMEYT